MTELNWPDLQLPAINLWVIGSAPVPKSCKHTHWMIFHGDRERWCYDCDEVRSSENYYPSHSR